jgi:hypothetical protein
MQLLQQRLSHTFRQTTPAPTTQGQAVLAIQTLCSLVIDAMTFMPKLSMQLRATPGTMGIRQLDQPRFNDVILRAALQDPTLRPARLCDQAASATLAKFLIIYRPCHRFAALDGR